LEKEKNGKKPEDSAARAETQAGTPAEPEKAEQPQEAPKDSNKELEEARRQLAETQEELNKQKDLLLRTAAEYDNFRKRTAKEKSSIYADATAAAVLEFLPVADNLGRALEQKECSAEDLRTGVEMVQKQLSAALEKLGVEEMGNEGDPFDPALHNAVAHVEDESAGENTIVKVFQKGYTIGGKVVRHAMVQVAN
jgi:molecular chaperone GrpE